MCVVSFTREMRYQWKSSLWRFVGVVKCKPNILRMWRHDENQLNISGRFIKILFRGYQMETPPLPVWRSRWWSSHWSWRSTERSSPLLRHWGSLHPCCRDWTSSALSPSECSCWSETAPVLLLLLHLELQIEDHLLPNAWPDPRLLSDTHTHEMKQFNDSVNPDIL